MTIYGKNLYVTKETVSKKPKSIGKLSESTKYSHKKMCRGCKKIIYMIGGKPHEVEPNNIGIHDLHRCK